MGQQEKYIHIESTPEVCGGVPRIKGRRITVFNIIGWYREGMTIQEMEEDFDLKEEEIMEALAYGTELGASTEIKVTPIEDLDIKVKTYNFLKKNKVKTLEQLRKIGLNALHTEDQEVMNELHTLSK